MLKKDTKYKNVTIDYRLGEANISCAANDRLAEINDQRKLFHR